MHMSKMHRYKFKFMFAYQIMQHHQSTYITAGEMNSVAAAVDNGKLPSTVLQGKYRVLTKYSVTG